MESVDPLGPRWTDLPTTVRLCAGCWCEAAQLHVRRSGDRTGRIARRGFPEGWWTGHLPSTLSLARGEATQRWTWMAGSWAPLISPHGALHTCATGPATVDDHLTGAGRAPRVVGWADLGVVAHASRSRSSSPPARSAAAAQAAS